jgi:hypothetical protein
MAAKKSAYGENKWRRNQQTLAWRKIINGEKYRQRHISFAAPPRLALRVNLCSARTPRRTLPPLAAALRRDITAAKGEKKSSWQRRGVISKK